MPALLALFGPLITQMGVKMFGELLNTAMAAYKDYLARADLEKSIRQEGYIESLKLANTANETKALLLAHPDAADWGVLIPDPTIPGPVPGENPNR